METAATHILRQISPAFTTGVGVLFVHKYLQKHEAEVAVAVEKVLALREKHHHWQHFNDVVDAVKTHLGEHTLLLIALKIEAAEEGKKWWDEALRDACIDIIKQALPHEAAMSTDTARQGLAEAIVKRCYISQMCRNVRKLWLRRNPPQKLDISVAARF